MANLHRLTPEGSSEKFHFIFLHGLGGHYQRTWQCSTDDATYWPKWLAVDIDDTAVWSVEYEAPISRWQGNAMHLTDRAENILGRLLTEAALKQGRIALIGHSLGGLVIKQLFRTLEIEAKGNSQAKSLLQRIGKVAFLATPHSGSELAQWGDRLRVLLRPSAATTCLLRNDPNLRDLNNWYRNWVTSESLSHLVLRETQAIKILGQIVKPDSADPAIYRVRAWGVDKDHWSIAKPPNKADEVYRHILEFLREPFESVKVAHQPQQDSLISPLQTFQNGTGNATENVALLERIANSNNPNRRDYLAQASQLSTIAFVETDAIDLALADIERGVVVEDLLMRCRESELPKILAMVPESTDPDFKTIVTAFKYNRYVARKNSPAYAKLNEFLSESVVHRRFTERALQLSREIKSELRKDAETASHGGETPPAGNTMSKSYRNKAVQLAAAAQYSEGMDAANDALRDDPALVSDTKFVFALAKCSAALGDVNTALMALHVLMAKNPSIANDGEFKSTVQFLEQNGLTIEQLAMYGG